MRRLLVTFALLLTVSPGAWAQPNPDRPLPRLPPLGQLPPDPQTPDSQPPETDQPPDQQPDAQPPQQQRPPQGGRIVSGRPAPRPPETDDQLLAQLAKAPWRSSDKFSKSSTTNRTRLKAIARPRRSTPLLMASRIASANSPRTSRARGFESTVARRHPQARGLAAHIRVRSVLPGSGPSVGAALVRRHL